MPELAARSVAAKSAAGEGSTSAKRSVTDESADADSVRSSLTWEVKVACSTEMDETVTRGRDRTGADSAAGTAAGNSSTGRAGDGNRSGESGGTTTGSVELGEEADAGTALFQGLSGQNAASTMLFHQGRGVPSGEKGGLAANVGVFGGAEGEVTGDKTTEGTEVSNKFGAMGECSAGDKAGGGRVTGLINGDKVVLR